ncbi:Ribosomal RNA-processing protein 12 [Podosphaera aphanis]|nr:Ribosomal RNA-processing protein 12 [Podosphaera aphanis]
MSLEEKLDKIRSPKLQSQQSTQIVLSAVEDTLREQKTEPTPAGYFAALLSLLRQAISTSIVNKELATSVVYLLDVVSPYTPQPLLRSKFSQILANIAPALTFKDADAPLLRPSIGCLESLLLAQDSKSWEMGQSQIGPRRALAGLLVLALDHRPKIRKKAQDSISRVLKNPPPSVAVDHPAAEMCAETALKRLNDLAISYSQWKKEKTNENPGNEPGLIHALQLVRTVAAASGGWPAKKIESLSEILINISKSNNEYMTMAVFEVFDIIFEGMAAAESSLKLPRLLEVISDIRPSQNDSQLLPPWIAVISRGYSVLAEIQPEETFQKLPELFALIAEFLSAQSPIIRTSASKCLLSLLATCIPNSVIHEPSIYDEKILEKLGKSALSLLSVKYQAAWLEVFSVLGAMFDRLRWQAEHILLDAVKIVGELRGNESFAGKKEADEIIGKAIRAIGPETVLNILPLNLAQPKAGHPGRAWMLPLLREYVGNTYLGHFRKEFIPLSEMIFQRIINNEAEKTLEMKIFETLIQQIWALLPKYCDLPLDVTKAFDQKFAELVSNLLYKQIELRPNICRALQRLVESNQAILAAEDDDDDVMALSRVTKKKAQENIDHLSSFASNMLAVLFNVYSQTLPQHRGYILQCIKAYLSIMPSNEVMLTFERVATMLEASLPELVTQTQAEKEKQKQKSKTESLPPTSHTLMDLVIAISIYLPRESFVVLFNIIRLIFSKDSDSQLQKKAYKLIPQLSASVIGQQVLQETSADLQQLIISNSERVSIPAKKDRLAAISTLISFLPSDSLHFVSEILSEVVISCKETNEKARTTAFDLLVLIGEKFNSLSGTVIENRKISHMPDNAPSVVASIEEYLVMVSAGLAGSTPHMQSACVTALTRLLYHFRTQLKPETITELVETLDLYLTSNNREIVRSVLGFVKVCVISLPTNLMLPRLPSLIPNLMVWSHEHKGQFKAKVKHIIERMIRRFGVDVVNEHCPLEDRKLIANIRKTKERNKRQKEAAKAADSEGSDDEIKSKSNKKGRFESEYDEAIYGSDDSSSGSDNSDNELLGNSGKGKRNRSKIYIVESEDEPLDLLDRKALANISSTRPVKLKARIKPKAKIDMDGKLILDDNNDTMVLDEPAIAEDENGGVNAYVDAIKGRNAVQRGRGGKLKFSNKKSDNLDEDEMDIDESEVKIVQNHIRGVSRSGSKATHVRDRPGYKGSRGVGSLANGRRGLGENKRRGQEGGQRRGGRVSKSSRGKSRR